MSLVELLRSRATAVGDHGGETLARDYGDVGSEWQALDSGVALLVGTHRRTIVATGSERADFLHGQLSADVRGIPAGGGAGALALTAQGRVVSILSLYDDADHDRILLTVDADRLDATLARLEQFLIADDVELEVEPSAGDRFLVAGPRAPEILARVGGPSVPSDPAWFVVHAELSGVSALLFGRGDLRVPSVEVATDGDASNLWEHLESQGARAAGTQAYEIVRVESGTARYGVDVDEERIATEARLEWCIHFAKGCYVGQEIVERSVSRGRLNRELVLLSLDGAVAAGDHVEGGGDRDVVTSVVDSPRLGSLALAYVDKQRCEPGTALTIRTGSGPVAATVSEWPRPRVLAGM